MRYMNVRALHCSMNTMVKACGGDDIEVIYNDRGARRVELTEGERVRL